MDDDLIAYLEKKIKTLEEELSKKSEAFEECIDSSIKMVHENIELKELLAQSKDENTRLKAELASRDGKPVARAVAEQSVSHGPDPQDRAARVTGLVAEIERLKAELKSFDVNHSGESQLSFFIQRAKEFEEKASRFRVLIDKSEERSRSLEAEIESLKKQLAAAPHWVPVEKFSPEQGEFHVVHGSRNREAINGMTYECIYDGVKWLWGEWQVAVTHVLVGLNPPVSNEDHCGDGDIDYPITADTDVKLSVEQMSDAFEKMIEVTRRMGEPQESVKPKRDLIVSESPNGLWHVWEQKTPGDYTLVAGPFHDSKLAHAAVVAQRKTRRTI